MSAPINPEGEKSTENTAAPVAAESPAPAAATPVTEEKKQRNYDKGFETGNLHHIMVL